MFNKNLLETIRSKTSEFENISLTLDDFSFARTDYDRINALMLFNSIADERKDNLVIFNPHGTIFTLYSLVILSFAELQRDLTDKKNAIENNLNVGDRVRLDGCLGMYEGRGIYNGRDHLKIRCGGKLNELAYVFIPEDLHRIQKYAGGATKLRGHKKKNEIKPGEALSGILKLDIAQLNIVRNSRIAVITEKKNIVDYLRLLKINGYNFTDIFSTARLINSEKYLNIPGTRLRGEPVVFIVSSFANLIDYVQRGNKINTVIIDGATKIRNNYGNINALKDEEKIESTLLAIQQDLEKEYHQHLKRTVDLDRFFDNIRNNYYKLRLELLNKQNEKLSRKIISLLDSEWKEYLSKVRSLFLEAEVEEFKTESMRLFTDIREKVEREMNKPPFAKLYREQAKKEREQAEKEASEDIKTGRVKTFDSVKDLVKDLEQK